MRALGVLILLGAWVGAVQAAEVSGVKLEDKLRLGAAGPELVLNGAGLRTRFFVKVYAAGLYLVERKAATADVLALGGPKRVAMHMVRDLSAQQLVDALNEGVAKNNPPAEVEKLKPQLAELTGIMTALGEAKKGDVVTLDFLPDAGTRVTVNGQEKGKPIPGGELYRALLRVWLGDDPVQDDLKKALLGQPG
jgi:hypothetical protein